MTHKKINFNFKSSKVYDKIFDICTKNQILLLNDTILNFSFDLFAAYNDKKLSL